MGRVVNLRTDRCAHQAEVQRLRRDLHDGLGPGLAGILIRADLLARQLSQGPAEEMLRELRHEAAEFMAEFRRVLADREPTELEGRSLADGLRVLAGRMHVTGLAIDVDVTGDVAGVADRDAQVAAFWIVKEALTNVVKHARATHCTVRLRADHGLRLSVVDDGIGGIGGIGGTSGLHDGGVGLTSMRARAEELGGWCEVVDTGHGVTVTGHLPEGRSRDDHAACA